MNGTPDPRVAFFSSVPSEAKSRFLPRPPRGLALDLVNVQPQPLDHLLADLVTPRQIEALQPQRPRVARRIWRDRMRASVRGRMRERVSRVRLAKGERRVGRGCWEGEHRRHRLARIRANVSGQTRLDKRPQRVPIERRAPVEAQRLEFGADPGSSRRGSRKAL